MTARLSTAICWISGEDNQHCPDPSVRLTLSDITHPLDLERLATSYWSKFLRFANDAGMTCSIIVCILLLGNIISGVLTYLLNVIHLARIHGLIARIFILASPGTLVRHIYKVFALEKDEKDDDKNKAITQPE